MSSTFSFVLTFCNLGLVHFISHRKGDVMYVGDSIRNPGVPVCQ